MSAHLAGYSPRTTSYALLNLDANVDAESRRLNKQHNLVLTGLGHRSPVPPEVDLSSVKTILDAAAGTCIWLLDVINQPEVRERISDMELYASDISLAKFPPAEVIDNFGIKVSEHDVTKPFPEELIGRFDLVHSRAISSALTPYQWRLALANFQTLLSM